MICFVVFDKGISFIDGRTSYIESAVLKSGRCFTKALQSKVPLQISFTHNFKYENLNTITLCTCTDSIAVGACATFHGDQTSNFQITAFTSFDLESLNP